MNNGRVTSSASRKAGYFILTIVFSLLTPVAAAAVGYLTDRALSWLGLWGAGVTVLLPPGLLLVGAGILYGCLAPLPNTFFSRHLPYFIPVYVAILAYALYMWNTGNTFMGGFLEGFLFLLIGASLAAFWLPFLITGLIRKLPSGIFSGTLGLLLILALVCASVAWVAVENDKLTLRGFAEDSIGHDVPVYKYMPFVDGEWNKLYKPDFSISLKIKKDYPRLDGAIAVLPVYAAFAQATYEGLDEAQGREYVACTNTPSAFARLLKGDIDLFFGVPPSAKQLQTARESGASLVITPLASEAFVFFVNKDNPVDDLTLEQIRAIYSKTVVNWKDVGGLDGPISPFQRPEGSGSQSAMQNMVMQGRQLARPLREEYYEGMGGVVRGVAEYRNGVHAIGYSFRWYATKLIANPDIKLLAVNGVAPTPENIASRVYPLTADLVMITNGLPSPETKALREWILGPEGQAIVKEVGYIPITAE